MNCEAVHINLVHYIHGEIDPGQRIKISTHLTSCQTCRNQMLEIENALGAVLSTPTITPSSDFEHKMAQRLPEVYDTSRKLSGTESPPSDPLARIAGKRTYRAPLLAASLLLHAAALGLIATFLLGGRDQQDPSAVRIGFEAFADQLPDENNPQLDEPAPSPAEEKLDDPFRIHESPGTAQIPPRPAPGIHPEEDIRSLTGTRLSPRQPQDPKRLVAWLRQRIPSERIRLFGSNQSPQVDRAVRIGLSWLAAHQNPDGSWNADSPGGSNPYRIGVTGLATLAFLAAGHPLHDEEEYTATIRRAVRFLERQLTPDGLIGPATGHYLYNHSIALTALVEARLMLPASKGLAPLQPAIDLLVGAQTPDGGWGYGVEPTSVPDTSVTGWAVAALWVSRQAGHEVPTRTLKRVRNWLERVTDPATGRVGYRDRNDYTGDGMGTTAVGLYLGGLLDNTDAGLRRKQSNFLTDASHLQGLAQQVNYHTWYHATAALHTHSGQPWTRWNTALRQTLLGLQEQTGSQRSGSWPPKSRYGRYAGRVYTTSIALLTLQTPHRYR